MGGGSPYDLATIKYSSAGIPLWTNRYPGLVHWENHLAPWRWTAATT